MTTAVQTLESVDWVMFAGQVIVGAWVSFTVTVNEQLAGFPDESLVLQVTVVVPFGKVAPDAGVQVTVGVTGGQLSVAVGAV